jgi:NAD(P)-dependent dehydrogenase (short-subunit alcohol dehydrogenase family)
MDLSAMQVALVTGAGSRLGQVLAKHLAKNGYMVVVHVNRSRDAGRKLVEEIVDGGHHAVMISCDFERSSSIVRFFEKVVRLHGLPHLIINNASVFKYDFPGKGSIELLDSSLAVHVKAPFILTELAYRKSRRGSAVTVVNILDQKVKNLNPDYYSYTVGKFGLLAITKIWQITPSSRIRVFGVLPGLLFPSGKQTQRDFERVRNNTILGRNPRPEEVAEAILLLARNKSMPGQNLVIDGGESLVRRARDIAYE